MKNNEINIRDPYVLKYEGKYYLYGTRGLTCWGLADGFDVYVGTDLENWSGPIEVFKKPEGFWADRHFWAPEVYYYKEAFYMFASFKNESAARGTQILKASSPIGPFEIHSDGPVTPRDWECLDGTLFIDPSNGPYMIFCHEWLQIKDGTMCAIELTKDLKKPVAEPKLLFKASEATWIHPIRDEDCFVTDGPFIYRMGNGSLAMIWSSNGEEGYAVAIATSKSGSLFGNWTQNEKLLFKKDGGHGMIFEGFDGKLYLALHAPNSTLDERPVFYEIEEKGGELHLK